MQRHASGTRDAVMGVGYGVQGIRGALLQGHANGTRYAVPCSGYI
jgi:hypothetical protein